VILAVAAGVGLVVILGGPPYALWARRRLRRAPGAFPLQLRPAGPLEGRRRPRAKRYGTWAHDVLLVHHGVTLARCEPLAVASVTGPVIGSRVRGLGDRAVRLRLHLDDGRLYDVAIRNGDVAAAIGPFVVASLRTA
jgi:hypothetical protein